MTDKILQSFIKKNKESGLRVFVAGGSRSGDDEIYEDEAFNLGRKIIKMDFKLDFGVANSGIMGAVAKGVLTGWNNKHSANPIQGVTTQEYLDLYPTDDELIGKIANVVVTKTLEERKRKLLDADFVVFAPGGVGTLDELAYDLVAMQDGFLPLKPFIFYNINGYFHHLLEYLKEISIKGFADPISFIVVDNSDELGIAFRMIKSRFTSSKNTKETYAQTRQLMYELPYFLKRMSENENLYVEHIVKEMDIINKTGTDEEQNHLANQIEEAYLEKEIERMHTRLTRSGQDTGTIIEKLNKLKIRKKKF